MMECADIAEILVRRGRKVCTSADVRGIVGREYLAWLSLLANTLWLMPIKGFRGVYYVRDAEEKLGGYLKLDGFSILIRALNLRFGDGWYFGRAGALGFSGLMHQPVSVHHVFNKKISRSFYSPVFGRVVLSKTSAKAGGRCGVEAKNHGGAAYYACSLERNIADALYLYVHGKAGIGAAKTLMENKWGRAAARRIIMSCFPANSARKMLSALGK